MGEVTLSATSSIDNATRPSVKDGLTDISDSWLEHIREVEYPSLKDEIYLDHAGTVPIAKSLLERSFVDLTRNLYGNPHSASASSQLTTRRIEDVRLDALRFFNADPAHFDLVFVANATAGIKLVMDAFRDLPGGFWYGYHVDSHTSLVGVREAAGLGSRCFASDSEVDRWVTKSGSLTPEGTKSHEIGTGLFAYPAQSNMNGRRLPKHWPRRLRGADQTQQRSVYSLLDAAALASTAPLDLSSPDDAPDFTVLSFYKIFGFPDLGGLIVRKDSAEILKSRKYFGGGTVDMVVSVKERWHASKSDSIHASLEDGTLPIHSIIALKHAMDVHSELFGSLKQVSSHTSSLCKTLHYELSSLRHSNGRSLCVFYKGPDSEYGDSSNQGPIISFNMCNSSGAWIPNSEVEKLASIRGIHVRAGGLCNPGGIATSLGLEPWEIRRNFSAGHRCGDDMDVISGKPTGMLRVSLGAASTLSDIQKFSAFLQEFFVEDNATIGHELQINTSSVLEVGDFYVESMTIYPIKSCGGWQIPPGQPWGIRQEGLTWDREWCLINPGTGKALSQKTHPKMALFRPFIDLEKGLLRVHFAETLKTAANASSQEISVPLSADPSYFDQPSRNEPSLVCGEKVQASAYRSHEISDFFSAALGVPCQLARTLVAGPKSGRRHAKAQIQPHQLDRTQASTGDLGMAESTRPILLSNESPILVISRSSLNRLNEQIKKKGGKAAQAQVFRANIVIAQEYGRSCGVEQPYIEDYWRFLTIGNQNFQVLGSCRRCQMVCIDQQTAEKNQEPFVTLSKTRRFDGKVWFGQHMCYLPSAAAVTAATQHPTIMVGDPVRPLIDGDCSPVTLVAAPN